MATSNQIQRERNARDYEIAKKNAETSRRGQESRSALEKEQRVTERSKQYKNAADIMVAKSQHAKNYMDALFGSAGKIAGAVANDPFWYVESEQRGKDVASQGFGISYGSVFRPDYIPGALDTTMNPSNYSSIDAAPGILRLTVAQTIGSNARGQLDKLASRLFDAINKNTGRTSDYESADILQYTVGLASIHSYHAMLRRAYATLKTYEAKNDYLPKRLLQAMGFDADDLRKHIYDLKGHINLLADELAVYPIIPGMTIFNRWMYEMGNVFKYTQNQKDQIYLMAPSHFLRINVGGTATELTPVRWIGPNSLGAAKTFDDVVAFTQSLLSGFEGWQDIKIMRSDILKQYDNTAIPHLPYVTGDDYLTYNTDERSLEQFRNAFIIGTPEGEEWAFAVTQENGSLVSNPAWAVNDINYSRANVPSNFIISTNRDNGDWVDVIESTRMIPSVEYEARNSRYVLNGFHHTVVTLATVFGKGLSVEIVDGQPVQTEKEINKFYDCSSYQIYISPDYTVPVGNIHNYFEMVGMLKSFEFSPVFRFIYQRQGVNLWATYSVQDWDNYAIITAEQLANMNKLISYRMFKPVGYTD